MYLTKGRRVSSSPLPGSPSRPPARVPWKEDDGGDEETEGGRRGEEAGWGGGGEGGGSEDYSVC